MAAPMTSWSRGTALIFFKRSVRHLYFLNEKPLDKCVGCSVSCGSVSAAHRRPLHLSSSHPTDSAPTRPPGSAHKAEKISQAMRVYLERATAHDQFMQTETAEYELGKRHLANMMGIDPDTFTQDDVDKAVAYLMPSGLFAKTARPKLKHPSEIIPKRKAAQFDIHGRPHNSFFYTGKPNFFKIMHDAAVKMDALKSHEDRVRGKQMPDPDRKLLLGNSVWLQKLPLEDKLDEALSDTEYASFLKLFTRLTDHPYAYLEEDFIMRYRKAFTTQSVIGKIPELKYDESGRAYQEAEGSRKTARAWVKVWDKGTGQVAINGKDLLDYFPIILDREQVLFPLQFTSKLGCVDFEARVERGSHSGQAGALRLALATALESMVDRDTVSKMRIAGLLTHDPRRRERKKYGQEGARRKFTWKKR